MTLIVTRLSKRACLFHFESLLTSPFPFLVLPFVVFHGVNIHICHLGQWVLIVSVDGKQRVGSHVPDLGPRIT